MTITSTGKHEFPGSSNLTSSTNPLRISVVTPSLNQGEFLEDAVCSVIGQGYPNLEYIVVDGASIDDSVNILERYSNKIDYCISEPDRGHWDALRKGFEISTGEVMGWINSDDKLTPWSLECVSQIFTMFPRVNWIQGIPARWNRLGYMTYAGNSIKNIYDFVNNDYKWIQQESVFWRRSLWEAAGSRVSDEYSFMVDGDLWARFFLHDQLYSVECILGGYRMHGANRALKYNKYCDEEMSAITSNLRMSSSSSTLEVARRLRISKAFCCLPIFKTTHTSQIAWKILAKTLIRESACIASYPSIAWDYEANTWKEAAIPFGL